MTKKQRAQVVELLRCAADLVHETLVPLTRAQRDAGIADGVFAAAVSARISVSCSLHVPQFVDGETYRLELLEAAARVEEESYP